MSKTVSVGLDIGSSAVRAAEVLIDGDKRTLRRFAQVGLPEGAVMEGEVRDHAVVATALEAALATRALQHQVGSGWARQPAGYGTPG